MCRRRASKDPGSTASFEEFDVLIVQPQKDRGDDERSDSDVSNKVSPTKQSIPAEGASISRMADALATVRAISF